MGTLNVNLKHLYQRRGLWLVYAFLGPIPCLCIAAVLDRPGVGKGKFGGFVLLSFISGLLAAMLALEVVTKPFSFCLPDHRKTLRQFLFVVGVTVSFLGSLVLVLYPGLRPEQLLLVICAACSMGLIFYWLAVAFALGIRSSCVFVGFLPLVILAGAFFDLHIIIERAVVANPFAVILSGVLSSVVAWLLLGNADLARRYCAVPWMGFFDAWNRDRIQRYQQARTAVKWEKLKTHPNPWVERYFLGRMQKCEYLSQGRHVWGGLYAALGPTIPQWKENPSSAFGALFTICLVVGFLGYTGPAGSSFIFVMPGLMLAGMRLPAYSSMLVSGGRKERFVTTITLVATIAVLTTVLVSIVAALSLPLAAVMPDVTLRGTTFAFHAMNTRLFFFPLLMMPIVFALQSIFFRKPVLIMLPIMMLFFGAIFAQKQLGGLLNPVHIVCALIFSWVVFLTVLRHTCMRRCLV